MPKIRAATTTKDSPHMLVLFIRNNEHLNEHLEAKYRRKGVGSLLLRAMEEFARKKKARVLMFDTAIGNIPALNLYVENGFRTYGYNDKTALHLAKEL